MGAIDASASPGGIASVLTTMLTQVSSHRRGFESWGVSADELAATMAAVIDATVRGDGRASSETVAISSGRALCTLGRSSSSSDRRLGSAAMTGDWDATLDDLAQRRATAHAMGVPTNCPTPRGGRLDARSRMGPCSTMARSPRSAPSPGRRRPMRSSPVSVASTAARLPSAPRISRRSEGRSGRQPAANAGDRRHRPPRTHPVGDAP